MIADVTHYIPKEGAEWVPWPFPRNVKPSNPELLANVGAPLYAWSKRGCGLLFHALRLSDGSVWDSINGFRDGGGPR